MEVKGILLLLLHVLLNHQCKVDILVFFVLDTLTVLSKIEARELFDLVEFCFDVFSNVHEKQDFKSIKLKSTV